MTERQYTEEQVRTVRKIMGESDLYKILGVTREAGETEFKRAYRKVSLRHKDRTGGSSR